MDECKALLAGASSVGGDGSGGGGGGESERDVFRAGCTALLGRAADACPDAVVGRCSLIVSKPVLNAPMVSTLEATI